jgi:hypothetical protein
VTLAADIGAGRSVRRSRGRLRIEPALEAKARELVEPQDPDVLSCVPAVPD